MIIFIFFLFFSIFISLFVLYVLSKNDFILLRKGISLLSIFNLTFISLIVGFVGGRLLYVLDNFNVELLNIINFFHVFKYPGFSILGGFLGGFLVLLPGKYSAVRLRVADIWALSFFPIYYFFIISSFALGNFLVMKIILIIILPIVFIFLLNFHKNYKLRDGSIALIIISVIAVVNFLEKQIVLNQQECCTVVGATLFNVFNNKIMIQIYSVSEILSIVIFALSLVLIVVNQKSIGKRRN